MQKIQHPSDTFSQNEESGKEYPPHVQRDYKIKNRKKLEDLKLRTFKDILNSFERNDFSAFEQLIKKDQPEYMSSRGLSLNERKNLTEAGIISPPGEKVLGGVMTHKASKGDPRLFQGMPLSSEAVKKPNQLKSLHSL
jgi:hypothetical protein